MMSCLICGGDDSCIHTSDPNWRGGSRRCASCEHKDAEIARLRELADTCLEDLIAERDHLSVENKRLRAALERCQEQAVILDTWAFNHGDADDIPLAELEKICEEALKHE